MRNFGPKLKPVKDMAVGGNKWARARVISKAIDEAVNKGNPKVKSINNEIGRIRANNIPDQEITEDMLRYAAKNYIKDTGMDNNMTEFFKSIVDWKEAAKWLSKWSTIIGTPVTISKMNEYDNSRILDGRNQ